MKRILFLVTCISLIPAAFAETNTPDKNSQLLEAAKEGNLAAVQTLLANGADANAKDFIGETALIGAVERYHIGVVKFLLERVPILMPSEMTEEQP
jgi:ankyrin repeat protein